MELEQYTEPENISPEEINVLRKFLSYKKDPRFIGGSYFGSIGDFVDTKTGNYVHLRLDYLNDRFESYDESIRKLVDIAQNNNLELPEIVIDISEVYRKRAKNFLAELRQFLESHKDDPKFACLKSPENTKYKYLKRLLIEKVE